MNYRKKLVVRLAAAALLIGSCISPAFAVAGTVNTGSDTLRLRDEASKAGEVLAKLENGTQVEVLAITEGGWFQVTYEDLTGYVSGDYLLVDETEAAALPVEADPIYIKVTTSVLNIRTEPTTESDKTGSLKAGRVVEALETLDGWYRIESGYVSADYVTVVDAAEAAVSGKGQEIADYAVGFVGYPYVYGGSSPKGFDCSGFTKYIYSQFGYSLNRTASNQLDNGVAVSRDELQPGDLVMFKKSGSGSSRASHVGIYIGNNQFVHASTSRVGVIISGMNEAYYTSGFVGGRRIV